MQTLENNIFDLLSLQCLDYTKGEAYNLVKRKFKDVSNYTIIIIYAKWREWLRGIKLEDWGKLFKPQKNRNKNLITTSNNFRDYCYEYAVKKELDQDEVYKLAVLLSQNLTKKEIMSKTKLDYKVIRSFKACLHYKGFIKNNYYRSGGKRG